MKPSIQTILHRVGLAFLLLTLSQNVALAGPFNEIVVFGDSLSDNGNLLLIPDQPKPDPTLYYQGPLSNGPVWVEYLADAQHLNVSLTDRALGGAMSDSLIPPGLIEQVPAYITAEGSPLSAKALFIVWIGGNDYLHGDGDSQATVNNIKDALEQLAQAKAMNILVLNLPNLGEIPATLNSPDAPQATAFSESFNSELADMLDAFSVEHPEISLYDCDVYSFFTSVSNDPNAYGFVNATDPSPNFAVENDFDGADYVFWDDIHPMDPKFTDCLLNHPHPPIPTQCTE